MKYSVVRSCTTAWYGVLFIYTELVWHGVRKEEQRQHAQVTAVLAIMYRVYLPSPFCSRRQIQFSFLKLQNKLLVEKKISFEFNVHRKPCQSTFLRHRRNSSIELL